MTCNGKEESIVQDDENDPQVIQQATILFHEAMASIPALQKRAYLDAFGSIS
jgi:hypothetical protein